MPGEWQNTYKIQETWQDKELAKSSGSFVQNAPWIMHRREKKHAF